ncbi:MAG: serine/threonine-protein phosphatase [Candidatus Riflebacteria bacterium]|nr:serine/threonine-protein phosphatase [Candidatus Riflebacteria bacterium]
MAATTVFVISLVTAASLVLLGWWFIHCRGSTLPVRDKLALVLLASGGCGALLFGTLGRSLASIHEYSGISRSCQAMVEDHDRMMREFSRFILARERSIRRLLHRAIPRYPPTNLEWIKRQILLRLEPGSFEIVGSQGQLLLPACSKTRFPLTRVLTFPTSRRRRVMDAWFGAGINTSVELEILASPSFHPFEAGRNWREWVLGARTLLEGRHQHFLQFFGRRVCAFENRKAGLDVPETAVGNMNEVIMAAIAGGGTQDPTGVINLLSANKGRFTRILLPDDVGFQFLDLIRDDRGIAHAMVSLRFSGLTLFEQFRRLVWERRRGARTGQFVYLTPAFMKTGGKNDRLQRLLATHLPTSSPLGRMVQGVMKDPADRQEYLIGARRNSILPQITFVAIQPTARIIGRFSSGKVTYLLGGLSIVTLLLGILLMFQSQLVRPLETVQRTVQAMQRGDFRPMTLPSRIEEFRRLERLFRLTLEHLRALNIAKVVQDSFLPCKPLVEREFTALGQSRMLNLVGGDYFDLLSIAPGRWLIALGDVSGHGLPAAIVVAMVRSAVLAFPHQDRTPADFLAYLNGLMFGWLARKRIMTLFIGHVDLETGVLRFANGGQAFPPIFGPSGTLRHLNQVSLPVGAMVKPTYRTVETVLERGETLILYSDGSAEATDRTGTPFGYDRLESALQRRVEAPPDEVIHGVLEDVREYTGECPWSDDVTMLIVKRAGPSTV